MNDLGNREVAQKWTSFLQKRCCPFKESPNYSRCKAKLLAVIIYGVIETIRYSFLSVVINGTNFTLIKTVGGVYRPLGIASRLTCICYALFCLGSVLVRITCYHRYATFLPSIIIPYTQENTATPLFGKSKEKFYIVLKVCWKLGRVVDFSVRYGQFVSALLCVYLIIHETSIVSIAIWIAWTAVQINGLTVLVGDLLWFCWAWFILKTHLDLEMIQVRSFINTDWDPGRKAAVIVSSFVRLEEKIHEFHRTSSEILATLIIVSGAVNGVILWMSITLHDRIIGFGFLIISLMCLCSFLFFVFSGTSLFRLSMKLNRSIFSFLALEHCFLTPKEQLSLLRISKTLGKCTPIALRTMFGQRFESTFIVRYIFYSFKISYFIINLTYEIRHE